MHVLIETRTRTGRVLEVRKFATEDDAINAAVETLKGRGVDDLGAARHDLVNAGRHVVCAASSERLKTNEV
jgi:hypothetical protein